MSIKLFLGIWILISVSILIYFEHKEHMGKKVSLLTDIIVWGNFMLAIGLSVGFILYR